MISNKNRSLATCRYVKLRTYSLRLHSPLKNLSQATSKRQCSGGPAGGHTPVYQHVPVPVGSGRVSKAPSGRCLRETPRLWSVVADVHHQHDQGQGDETREAGPVLGLDVPGLPHGAQQGGGAPEPLVGRDSGLPGGDLHSRVPGEYVFLGTARVSREPPVRKRTCEPPGFVPLRCIS